MFKLTAGEQPLIAWRPQCPVGKITRAPAPTPCPAHRRLTTGQHPDCTGGHHTGAQGLGTTCEWMAGGQSQVTRLSRSCLRQKVTLAPTPALGTLFGQKIQKHLFPRGRVGAWPLPGPAWELVLHTWWPPGACRGGSHLGKRPQARPKSAILSWREALISKLAGFRS